MRVLYLLEVDMDKAFVGFFVLSNEPSDVLIIPLVGLDAAILEGDMEEVPSRALLFVKVNSFHACIRSGREPSSSGEQSPTPHGRGKQHPHSSEDHYPGKRRRTPHEAP